MKMMCIKIGVNSYNDPIYRTVEMTHIPRHGLTSQQAEDRHYGDGEAMDHTASNGYETCVGDSARIALGWEIASQP